MGPRRSFLLRSAVIAAMLALLAVAPASAQSSERQAIPVHPIVDNFIAYLKSETQQAARDAARFARENEDLIGEAKSRIAAQIQALSAALSAQKEPLETLGGDVSALWEAWRETAVSSWAAVEQHAISALDWVLGFLRTQSQSDQRPEIPV
jgi:hypothetical protein